MPGSRETGIERTELSVSAKPERKGGQLRKSLRVDAVFCPLNRSMESPREYYASKCSTTALTHAPNCVESMLILKSAHVLANDT